MEHLKMSARNAAYQQFETLKRNREKRHRQKLFFLEGVHPIEQALAGGFSAHALGCAEGERLSGWAEDMIRRLSPEILYRIAPDLMAELSGRDDPCELIGLFRTRADGLNRLKASRGENPLIVVFDRPQGPGNLGTVIRTLDAFSADGILTTGHSADFYDPQCIRASVGTLFARPFAALAAREEALTFIRSLNVPMQIVGTSARGDVLIDDVDFTKPTLLLIGNETFGLSAAWKAECHALAKIPISGAASSLNAGVAAGICLYEAARQRRLGLYPPFK